MPVPPRPFALFGAALDCRDDPDSLSLRLAATLAAAHENGAPADPYDVIVARLRGRAPAAGRFAGKLTFPGHLSPRPPRESLPQVTSRSIGGFLSSGGCRRAAGEVREFVERNVLPDRPAMIGVDHALTFGVLEALLRSGTVPALSLVVIDSHLDAVPLPARVPGDDPLAHEQDSFSCGNWLVEVIRGGLVQPPRTAVLGVTDDPPLAGSRPAAAERYARCYGEVVSAGVTVVPAREIRSSSGTIARVIESLADRPIYLSLDVDAALDPTHGACRYPVPGALGPATTLAILEQVTRLAGASGHALAGFDIMETDVHLLGLEFPDGTRDETADFLARALQLMLNPPPSAR